MEYREALSWRVFRDDSGDHYMFFDAATEAPATRELDKEERAAYLDSVVSVSAVDRDRDQLELIDGCDRSPEGDLPF